jgi:predicted O-linked N-acetylglucosamine transferase (SPINDLY family)
VIGNINQILEGVMMMQAVKSQKQEFVRNLKTQISEGFDHPKALNYLLAAMLYCYPHQLDLQHDFDRIPDWLLEPYINFLLKTPPIFNEQGEVKDYFAYFKNLINYLHENILKNSNSDRWTKIASLFTSKANLIPLYFTDANLKEIYAKRAEIIEFSLKSQGYALDYEFSDRPPERRKIRLGILAAHFIPQSETFASLPAYKHLNRDQYEIILFSMAKTEHRLEKYCIGHADVFVVLPTDLADQVQTIRKADLDAILIVTNVTAVTNRIALLSLHRLARIQIANVCSCVSTGMRNVDYYISGTLTDADKAQDQYSENLLSIDGPSHCYDYATEENVPPTETVRRADFNISDNEIVYISGSNFFKITPEVEAIWIEILKRVPRSKLVLYPFNPNWSNAYPRNAFLSRIHSSLKRAGVDENRLVLLEPAPTYGDVKERLKLGDVYLDSYPFSGVTSLLDPLQVGLPPIVMDGNSFRSRMGPAFLRELSMPELIANDDQDYIHLAVELGTNPLLRKHKQQQIEQAMQRSPRFTNSRYHSAQIGAILQQLFQQHQVKSLQQSFNLRQNSLIAFPDWNQPEEDLFVTLADLLRFSLTHTNYESLTLLIHTGNWDGEDANEAISSVLLYLMSEEGIEAGESPEIVLIEPFNLTPLLITQLSGRVALAAENHAAIQASGAAHLPVYSIQAVSV